MDSGKSSVLQYRAHTPPAPPHSDHLPCTLEQEKSRELDCPLNNEGFLDHLAEPGLRQRPTRPYLSWVCFVLPFSCPSSSFSTPAVSVSVLQMNLGVHRTPSSAPSTHTRAHTHMHKLLFLLITITHFFDWNPGMGGGAQSLGTPGAGT